MAKKAKKEKNAKPSNAATAAADAPTYRRYRDAVTGRFGTKKYAKKNRKTTTKESLPS